MSKAVNESEMNVDKKGRMYVPYLVVPPRPEVNPTVGALQSHFFGSLLAEEGEDREMDGRKPEFREPNWRPPFDNDMKVWETSKRRKGGSSVAGTGAMELLEF